MAKNMSIAQVHELLEQQKTFFKESLSQLESSYKNFVQTIMNNTSSRLDSILKDVEDLKSSLLYTQKDVDQLKESCNRLSSDCKSANKDLRKFSESLVSVESKSEYLEGQSRCNNLIIDGIPEAEGEKWADTERMVLDMFREKLDIVPTQIVIERAHRIGKSHVPRSPSKEQGPHTRSDRPRPIVVKLLRFKDKGTVLRKASKLRGTNIFINEDFPEAVRQRRKELLPKMMEARKNGLYAVLRYDKLITRPGRP